MANYLTPEEEFELMYGEELEMMNDFEEPENIAQPIIASTQKPISQKDNTLLSSPALSQISRDESQFPFTPSNLNNINKKKTSTPFFEKLKSIDEQYEKASNPKEDALNEIQNLGMKRKRKLEDLFGDIYDIEEDDIYLKRHKTEEDRDLETIQKILDARKVFNSNLNPLKKDDFDRLEELHKFKKDNISKTIPRYPFMTLSNSDDRYYIRFHSEDFEQKKLMEIEAHNLNGGKFFGSHTEQLWQEANQIILQNVQGSSQMRQLAQENNTNHNLSGSDLWVEKYCPKKYFDLLSDESTNRSLLQWIKLWDKAVFNRESIKKASKPGEMSNFNKKTGRFEQNGGWIKSRKRGNMLNTELDENGVPIQKIALLVGKPGLGKTTLAHVIAKHAGYEVREMNASDDRNVESFRQILENCTQMKSVLNRENRPNCIILDEIDGAPQPSVEFLIRFVSGQVSEKSKKGKNNKKFVLKRPIICICNDLYGANLRNLRQMAFVVNFQSIDNARLAERLLNISTKEHVKTDMTAMLALAEKTGGDIRSSISVIQFFKNNPKKSLTLFDVLKSNVGQKDQHKTLFNVWSSIFQIQRPKKVIKESTNNQQKRVIGMSDMSMRSRMMHVLDMVSSCGEYEKLGQGVFENFLKQKISDTNMTSIVEASKWFCFNDIIQNKINTLQNYIIYPYLQYAFICWHFCFSSMAYPQITYPQKNYEVSQKLATSKQIFESLKKGIVSNGIRAGHELLIDTIGLLKHIICPEIRSVSMHLLTQNEKNDLLHTVEIYADFGISLIQFQTMDGTYTYRSDPDIDHFSFVGMPVKQISYWSKQIIAQEVQVEKMRRTRPKVGDENEKKRDKEIPKESSSKTVSPTSENKTLPNHLQRLIPKSVKEKQTSSIVCKDFFGRVVTKSDTLDDSSSSDSSRNILLKSPIWFKYKVGFNNAVRKDIQFSDLM